MCLGVCGVVFLGTFSDNRAPLDTYIRATVARSCVSNVARMRRKRWTTLRGRGLYEFGMARSRTHLRLDAFSDYWGEDIPRAKLIAALAQI